MLGYRRAGPGSSGDSLWLHNSRFNESSFTNDPVGAYVSRS